MQKKAQLTRREHIKYIFWKKKKKLANIPLVFVPLWRCRFGFFVYRFCCSFKLWNCAFFVFLTLFCVLCSSVWSDVEIVWIYSLVWFQVKTKRNTDIYWKKHTHGIEQSYGYKKTLLNPCTDVVYWRLRPKNCIGLIWKNWILDTLPQSKLVLKHIFERIKSRLRKPYT